MIIIDARPVGSSQTGQNIVYTEETNSALQSVPQVTVADAEGTEVRNEFEIEVIKSIVYGGLAESMASLGVVSSAAAGGADTCKYSVNFLDWHMVICIIILFAVFCSIRVNMNTCLMI